MSIGVIELALIICGGGVAVTAVAVAIWLRHSQRKS